MKRTQLALLAIALVLFTAQACNRTDQNTNTSSTVNSNVGTVNSQPSLNTNRDVTFGANDNTNTFGTNINAVTNINGTTGFNTNTTLNTNAGFGTNTNTTTGTVITISATGFSPPIMTARIGDTITWMNNDTVLRQIASDPHPQHSAVPGLMAGLQPGKSYQFTFTNAGTYGYHDEVTLTRTGQIIVQ